MSFPLYRLPFVALREVLSEAGPREIFLLSTCSRRSFRIVKSIKRSPKKWEIVFAWYGIAIEVENEDGETDYLLEVRVFNTTDAPKALEVINIGSYNVLLEAIAGSRLHTYWDDVIIGNKEITNYLTEIFHRSIDQLDIMDEPKWRVDWLNTRQNSIKILYYETWQPNVEDISYVFSNLKVDNSMCAIFHFPDQLARPEINIAPISLITLYIGLASWMTLEHILTFDCEYSYFSPTNLSSQDLHYLLKHWVNGGFPRLGELSVSTNEVFNYEIVLEGMEFEEISLDVVRQYPIYDGVRQTNGGFDVTRRSDGSTVTLVKGGDRYFHLVLTSRMQAL